MFQNASGPALLLLEAVYLLSVVGVSLYGLHAFWMTYLLLRRAGRNEPIAVAAPAEWPTVTVQLPLYNERHVVERLVDAVAALDYPRERLQIQILDDSDDSTQHLSEELVRLWRRRGLRIDLVRRAHREGYKAGALAFALPRANGEFIAIFDADFLPPRDFLRRALPCFYAPDAEDVAFVQGRWEHLNRDYSLLTRCQALALDGHFGVEQPARWAAGYAFGFNGSAGVWRRAAIEDPAVGGWQSDTLCEDLDLAYRAQLAGWRGTFAGALAAPAEIPPQLLAFKRQQARWAKGSVQTLVKLAGRVRTSGWPRLKRLAALLHLGNYLIHPLLLSLVLSLVLLVFASERPPALLAALSVASLGSPLLYGVSQFRLHRNRWFANWSVLPLLMLLGIGVALGNSVAVFQGLGRRGGAFARTPKFQVESRADGWRGSVYRLPIGWQTVAEGLLACFCLAGVVVALGQADPWTALYVGLFAASFAVTFTIEIWQARPMALTRARPAGWQDPESARAVETGS